MVPAGGRLVVGPDLAPAALERARTRCVQLDAELIVAAAEEAGVRLDIAAAAARRYRRTVEAGHAERGEDRFRGSIGG